MVLGWYCWQNPICGSNLTCKTNTFKTFGEGTNAHSTKVDYTTLQVFIISQFHSRRFMNIRVLQLNQFKVKVKSVLHIFFANNIMWVCLFTLPIGFKFINKGRIALVIQIFQGKFRCNISEGSCSIATNKIYQYQRQL